MKQDTHTELRLISCKKRVEASKLKQTVAAKRQSEHAAIESTWKGRGQKAKLTNGNKPVLNRSLTL